MQKVLLTIKNEHQKLFLKSVNATVDVKRWDLTRQKFHALPGIEP